MDIWINLSFFKFVTCLVKVLSEEYICLSISVSVFFFCSNVD